MSKPSLLRKIFPPKLIACELGPNYTRRDALGWWLNPARPEEYLADFVDLGGAHYWVDSGRTGLTLLLRSLQMPGERVMLQGYSCVVVPNAVRAAGMRPVVVDVEPNGFNLDLDVVEAQAQAGVRVLIVQHTYGIPVDMDRLMRIVKEYNLILIEDMAHALGNRWRGRLLGTFGYGAVYSFGRDKVVSSGTGGLVVLHEKAGEKSLGVEYNRLPAMSGLRVFRQLYYLVMVTLLVRPLYHWQIGKALLFVSQKLALIGPVFTEEEKTGTATLPRASRYSPLLKKLLVSQLRRLSTVQSHRLGLVTRYNAAFGTAYEQPLLRYPLVLTPEQSLRVRQALRRGGILVGTWYREVFIPTATAARELGITEADLPSVRRLLESGVLNLPTHTNATGRDARKILEIVEDTIDSN